MGSSVNKMATLLIHVALFWFFEILWLKILKVIYHAFLLLSCGENLPQIKTLSRTNESKKELVISWPLELVIVPTIDVWH
jgi:hypothetical protein